MKTSWQTDTGHLECRWSDPGELRRNDSWMHDISEASDRSAVPSIPDFARHSPLGSGEWFAPWNVRWSVPERTQLA